MAVLQTTLTVVMRQFAKDTVWKLLTCNLNLKDEIGDLSNTIEGLDDNIQDNSAKIEETENLAQNLVDLNNTISVKMQETETLVQNLSNLENSFDENQAKIQKNENDLINLNGTVHDNFVRIKAFENHVKDFNDLQDTVIENAAKIKGIYFRSALILHTDNLFNTFALCSLQSKNHFHIIKIYSCLH